MLAKIVHVTGLVVIIIFSLLCIYFSSNRQSFKYSPNENIRKFSGFASYFEDNFFDSRMNITLNHTKKDNRILLLEIDDESITKIGRYPWSRKTWSEMIDKLKLFGAKVVSFDVFFWEDEKACKGVSPDKLMGKSIESFQSIPGNRIILPYKIGPFNESVDTKSKKIIHEIDNIPGAIFDNMVDSRVQADTYVFPSYINEDELPVDVLLNAESSLAHISARSDQDGTFRNYQMIASVGDLILPSFGLFTYEKFTGEKTMLEINNVYGDTVVELNLKKGKVELNVIGETKVRWFGDMETFPTVKAWKVRDADINDENMKALFKNKIVFVGSTAFGAHDFRKSPIDSQMPGVYQHMNLVNMLLDGNFYKTRDESNYISWIFLFGGTLIIVLVMLFGHALLDIGTMAALTVGLYLLDTYKLTPLGYELKLFFSLFSIIAVYSWTTFVHFYSTSKEKKYIRGTFSRFVAPAIVDKMLNNPDMVKVGGEKRDITVFFSDVRDFTSISEKLTPEELSTCLNQYMGAMTDILFDNLGTLDKYIGDAIVAYWNAPADVTDHAYQAVRTSIIMIEKLPEINVSLKEQGFPEFRHGIGLNTGFCSVGNMGSDKIFSYTALGDNMNLGARIESLCKKYGVQLNVSEYTIDAMTEEQRNEFTYRMLDKVAVKGKTEPVTIYEVFHNNHIYMKDKDSLEEYKKAFALRLDQKFEDALSIFEALVAKYPEDKASALFIEGCKVMLENPPGDDWDGVTIMTEK